MNEGTSIHLDETQPIEINEDGKSLPHVSETLHEDETIPILIFQNRLTRTPSWWESAVEKATASKQWFPWQWGVYFGIASFLIMSVFSWHTLNQKSRDIHLVISNSDSFFDDSGGWATLNGVKGRRTQQGLLFEEITIGRHEMTIGFADPTCPQIRQNFDLNIGTDALTIPLKEWACDKTL